MASSPLWEVIKLKLDKSGTLKGEGTHKKRCPQMFPLCLRLCNYFNRISNCLLEVGKTFQFILLSLERKPAPTERKGLGSSHPKAVSPASHPTIIQQDEAGSLRTAMTAKRQQGDGREEAKCR